MQDPRCCRGDPIPKVLGTVRMHDVKISVFISTKRKERKGIVTRLSLETESGMEQKEARDQSILFRPDHIGGDPTRRDLVASKKKKKSRPLAR